MRRVSSDFPPEKADHLFKDIFVEGALRNRDVNPSTGDITTAVTYGAIRQVGAFVWRALGYLDIIEQDTLATTRGLGHAREAIATVQAQIADLRASVDRLVDFLGVTIPAWGNKEEVEKGDDMGIARPSASALELTVDFQFERQVDGFGHEDVISIDPPAGTLVKRGSSVTVTLNLEG
jgi:hypothetical protein